MFIARRFFPYLNECPQQTLTFNREFKEIHFWGTNVNQKWVFFSFNMPWGHHICNAKFFLTLIETICPKMFSKLRLKSAKSPLSVDLRRSKTSLLKLPILKLNMWPLDSKTNLNYISGQLVLHLFSCDRYTWVECYIDSVFFAPTQSLI